MTWLITQSFAGLLAYDLVLALFGFKRVHAVARAWPSAQRRRGPSTERICRAVAEACVWYPKRALCLQRSWTATLLLRRYGAPAQLVIGYRPMPIDSHAWVEVDGRVVNDRPQYQKFYRVLDRL
jgi:Transglutaminase-like superfamily